MVSVFEHNAYFPAVVTCECGMRIRPTHKHFPPNYEPEIVYCPFCGKELPMKTEFTSNADRIRAMSDEELAMFIADMVDHPWCSESGCPLKRAGACAFPEKPCDESALDWLKSPVEDNE